MCNKKYFDALSVGASILIGIAFSLLTLFGLVNPVTIAPLIGLALSVLSLLLLVIAGASLLQQNDSYNDCMCRSARKLLLGAIWLLIISIFVLVFLVYGKIVFSIFSFFIFSLMSFTLFSLYCWLKCLLSVGCSC